MWTLIRLREQSDLGPYCLQYRLPKKLSSQELQATKLVTGGLRVNLTKSYDDINSET